MTLPLSWLLLATHVPGDGKGGGMARYVVELARALEAHDEVELSVLASPGAAEVLRDELCLPQSRLVLSPTDHTLVNALGERSGLVPASLRHGFDVVHGTKHLVPRRTPALRVLTVHDTILLDRPQDFGALKRHLLKGPYLASMADADLLLAVSAASARAADRWVPGAWGRTTVVPLAVASRLLEARPEPVAGLEAGRCALVVSDFTARKNVSFLLRAWPRVVARRAGATLVVVGPRPAPGSTAHEDLVTAERAGGVVHLGFVADAQLRWLYEHVALTVCPSVVEGFGLPTLEAVTFHSPVLASTDPAMAEAAGGRATTLPLGDVGAWVDDIVNALGVPRRPVVSPSEPRRWTDVAAETVAAVRARLAGTSPGAPAPGAAPFGRGGQGWPPARWDEGRPGRAPTARSGNEGDVGLRPSSGEGRLDGR